MNAPTRIAVALAVVVGSASAALADDYLSVRSGSAYASQNQQPLIEGRDAALRGYASTGVRRNSRAFTGPEFVGPEYSAAADSVYRATHFDMGD